LCGLLVGERAADVVVKAREKKLLILTAGTDVVRILPPLTTTKAEIDQCVTILDQVFQLL
jgi:acetylornithine aminotransferase